MSTEDSESSVGYEFDCPRCEYTRFHRTPLGGALVVMWHFFTQHGWYSFRVGCPLCDADPPEFGTEDDEETDT